MRGPWAFPMHLQRAKNTLPVANVKAHSYRVRIIRPAVHQCSLGNGSTLS